MRRCLIGLVLVSGCGSIRTVSFEEEDDDGCDTADCETGTTAIPTGSSSMGSGGSDTEDDGDGGEEDGGTTTQFVPTPDMDDVQMCDVWDQETCPEGEKCTAYATMGSFWDAHKCVPVMGDDQWRDPCLALGDDPGVSGLDTCAKGADVLGRE